MGGMRYNGSTAVVPVLQVFSTHTERKKSGLQGSSPFLICPPSTCIDSHFLKKKESYFPLTRFLFPANLVKLRPLLHLIVDTRNNYWYAGCAEKNKIIACCVFAVTMFLTSRSRERKHLTHYYCKAHFMAWECICH